MAEVKVNLRKVLDATVTVEDPIEIEDELDWYDEVERLAWEKHDKEGGWLESDSSVESVEGGKFG